MKVQQAQTVEHVGFSEGTNTFEEVGCGEPELGQITARFLPLAAPTGRQFEAEANTRADAEALATRQQRVQLKDALHHNKDALADLHADQSQFDIARVLHPVADNGRVPIVSQRQCNGQLGLAANLKTGLVRVSKAEDIQHHFFLLVDLDGIGRDVVFAVTEFLDRRLKGSGQNVQLMLDNLGETQHDRRSNALVSELGNQIFEWGVSGLRRGEGTHDFPVVIHPEVLTAPVPNTVQRDRLFQHRLGRQGAAVHNRDLGSPHRRQGELSGLLGFAPGQTSHVKTLTLGGQISGALSQQRKDNEIL